MTKYSDTRPKSARTVVATRRGPEAPAPEESSAAMSDTALNIKADKILAELRKRKLGEDTGVHQLRQKELASTVADLLVDWRKKSRRGLWASVGGIIAAVVATLGGYGTYQSKTADQEAATVEGVKETVTEKSDSLRDQVEANRRQISETDRSVRNVGKSLIELEDTNVIYNKFLSDKIDAISPKARRIEPPAKVREDWRRASSNAADTRFEDRFGVHSDDP